LDLAAFTLVFFAAGVTITFFCGANVLFAESPFVPFLELVLAGAFEPFFGTPASSPSSS